MLINCPRCGFSQPNDQYCAQCGVDMQSYKPKELPAYKKILGSGLFQVSLLVIVAALVGQSIIRSNQPQKWVQKITHFQGVTKSSSQTLSSDATAPDVSQAANENQSPEDDLNDLKNQELAIPISAAAEQPLMVANNSLPISGNNTLAAREGESAKPTALNYKVTYAEVNRETLAKWINDSEAAGLYQNLSDYSAGILTDFRKRSDLTMRNLQSNEDKLAYGQPKSFLAAKLSEEASPRMLGLSTEVEFKNNEGGALHGTIAVSRITRQGRENFPAEFDLPQGAVFFMIGVLKNNQFLNDKALLTMPPFQILNSNDFMTQKTEFVIIVEPEYK